MLIKDVKSDFWVKFYKSIGWDFWQGVGDGIGRCVGDESESDNWKEVGEGAEL